MIILGEESFFIMLIGNLVIVVVYGKVWCIYICVIVKKYCGIKFCWFSIILVNLFKRNFLDGLKILLCVKFI